MHQQIIPNAIVINSTAYIKSYIALSIDGKYIACTYGYPGYVGYGNSPTEAIKDMCASIVFIINAKKDYLSAAPRSK